MGTVHAGTGTVHTTVATVHTATATVHTMVATLHTCTGTVHAAVPTVHILVATVRIAVEAAHTEGATVHVSVGETAMSVATVHIFEGKTSISTATVHTGLEAVPEDNGTVRGTAGASALPLPSPPHDPLQAPPVRPDLRHRPAIAQKHRHHLCKPGPQLRIGIHIQR